MIKNWLLLSSVAFGVGFGLSLPLNRDVKQAALTGLTTVPAAAAGVIAVDLLQKRRFGTAFLTLHTEIEELEQKKQGMSQSLIIAKNQQESLEAQIQLLEEEKQGSANAATLLEAEKQGLVEESHQLQVWLRELKVQEEQLNQILSKTALEHHQTEMRLTELNEELTQRLTPESEPQNQLLPDSSITPPLEQEVLLQDLVELELTKSRLEKQSQFLYVEITTLAKQEESFNQSLAELDQQQRSLKGEIKILMPSVEELQRKQEILVSDVETLTATKNHLLELLQELREQSQITQTPDAQPLFSEPSTSNIEVTDITKSFQLEPRDRERSAPYHVQSIDLLNRVSKVPIAIDEFRLWNLEHTQWLWNDVILPRWSYPPFLGSVGLSYEGTEEVWGTKDILDVIGANLRLLGLNHLETDELYDRCAEDSAENWLKTVTFAFSEYAYLSDQTSSFWKGLCLRLQLPYQGENKQPIRMLKELARDGIKLLELPEAIDGYPLVSTLWLQNGIPRHNLNHFADLVADLKDSYGWNYLATVPTHELAKELLNSRP